RRDAVYAVTLAALGALDGAEPVYKLLVGGGRLLEDHTRRRAARSQSERMSSESPASIPTELQRSASARVRAWREMSLAVRAATAIVTAAAAEDRGLLRSACIATEQTGRAGIDVVRSFAEQSRTA